MGGHGHPARSSGPLPRVPSCLLPSVPVCPRPHFPFFRDHPRDLTSTCHHSVSKEGHTRRSQRPAFHLCIWGHRDSTCTAGHSGCIGPQASPTPGPQLPPAGEQSPPWGEGALLQSTPNLRSEPLLTQVTPMAFPCPKVTIVSPFFRLNCLTLLVAERPSPTAHSRTGTEPGGWGEGRQTGPAWRRQAAQG